VSTDGGARERVALPPKGDTSGGDCVACCGRRCSGLRTGSRGEGSWLGSLASACAGRQHPVVTAIEAEPARPEAGPQARVGMPSALFGRLVISWESPGLSRPTPSPGGSSAGTAAMPPSPGSSSAERTGARPSPVLLVCSSRSRSPSPAWDAMAACSGRVGLPICICGRIARLGEREPPTECERAGTQVRPAKEGGNRCHRNGRRRMRRQPRRARRGSPSRGKRPRAGSSRSLASPSAAASSGWRARRSQTGWATQANRAPATGRERSRRVTGRSPLAVAGPGRLGRRERSSSGGCVQLAPADTGKATSCIEPVHGPPAAEGTVATPPTRALWRSGRSTNKRVWSPPVSAPALVWLLRC
jgi:hypothetical protein